MAATAPSQAGARRPRGRSAASVFQLEALLGLGGGLAGGAWLQLRVWTSPGFVALAEQDSPGLTLLRLIISLVAVGFVFRVAGMVVHAWLASDAFGVAACRDVLALQYRARWGAGKVLLLVANLAIAGVAAGSYWAGAGPDVLVQTLIHLAIAAHFVRFAIPPGILLLGVSGSGAGRLRSRLRQAAKPLRLASLLELPAEQRLAASGGLDVGDFRLAVDGDWEAAVTRLAHAVPLIVLDLRAVSACVLRELQILREIARLDRTVVVVDRGSGQARGEEVERELRLIRELGGRQPLLVDEQQVLRAVQDLRDLAASARRGG